MTFRNQCTELYLSRPQTENIYFRDLDSPPPPCRIIPTNGAQSKSRVRLLPAPHHRKGVHPPPPPSLNPQSSTAILQNITQSRDRSTRDLAAIKPPLHTQPIHILRKSPPTPVTALTIVPRGTIAQRETRPAPPQTAPQSCRGQPQIVPRGTIWTSFQGKGFAWRA
jgi:hypothetical protein